MLGLRCFFCCVGSRAYSPVAVCGLPTMELSSCGAGAQGAWASVAWLIDSWFWFPALDHRLSSCHAQA